ncbi:class I SAM-dependent methyltransferase [Horticoccus sp. 23ND18S-11]|uniref:class I SAM-dependent methyltransferase n=1 Tax=Horticoccus sp. 23ND18S-11 TaxID=3391832 RepID=UPI0039C94316
MSTHPDRIEGLQRLNDASLSLSHVYYLHLRTLFPAIIDCAQLAHGDLLDIGCGNKPYEQHFKPSITSYTGCDVIQSSANKVDIICPATDIPLPERSFDTVLCTQVLEHVAEPRRVIAESFRLLRKNGTMLLTCPMYWPLHEEPFDFFRYTTHGLRYIFEEAGFSIESIHGNGGKWATCGQAIQHAIQGGRLDRRSIRKLINRIFAHMDDKYPDQKNTMNYILIARKLT